jgi:predicted glycosyltransferase
MLGAGDRPLVVVTAGGGGDGFEIFKTYLEALPHSDTLRGAHSVLVTGPLMARGKRELLHHAAGDPNLTLIEFTPDLVSYLAAADLAISMAGYNTVCEILAQGTRSLLVPRTRPRTEQLLRAERLAARGLARMLHPDELSPSRLIAEVESALGWTPRCPAFALDGLDRTTAALAELLGVPEIARATRI